MSIIQELVDESRQTLLLKVGDYITPKVVEFLNLTGLTLSACNGTTWFKDENGTTVYGLLCFADQDLQHDYKYFYDVFTESIDPWTYAIDCYEVKPNE